MCTYTATVTQNMLPLGQRLHSAQTCDLGDALQRGQREGEDDALAGPHPQQALAHQQARHTNPT